MGAAGGVGVELGSGVTVLVSVGDDVAGVVDAAVGALGSIGSTGGARIGVGDGVA